MQKCKIKICLIVGMTILLIEINMLSTLNVKSTSNLMVDTQDYISENTIINRKLNSDNKMNVIESDNIPEAYYYIEQTPAIQSEWDGVYEKYTLVSQDADIHFNIEGEYGSSNISKYEMKYKLKDRYFDSYYKTNITFNITSNPSYLFFNFPKLTNISFMRFYFYDSNGLDYAPAVYEVYNGSSFVARYHYTPRVNGQWIRVNFPYDIIKTMNFTLKILQTRGSIDHPNSLTKVVINEMELFENIPPRKYAQDNIKMYEGVTKFWNGLDWALSLRVDDCWFGLSSFPSWWADILPITVMLYNPWCTIDVTLVETKHIEVGSHGHTEDHKANYNKDYIWWYIRAVAAKSSIETFTSKTSIWSDKCISFAIPYSVMDPPGGRAFFDVGFKWVGSVPGPSWKLRHHGRQNLSIYNVSEPKNNIPLDWMFTNRAGNVTVEWDSVSIPKFKENNSLATLLIHPLNTLDLDFKLFVENDTSGWHCTLGEISSYWWYKEHLNVTYNSSSTETEKIFDINIFENDSNVWEVPVTFVFNLTNFDWDGNVEIKWRNCDVSPANKLKNISCFSPGVGQHTNQTMREGYRWDSLHRTLFISIKPGHIDQPKSICISEESTSSDN